MPQIKSRLGVFVIITGQEFGVLVVKAFPIQYLHGGIPLKTADQITLHQRGEICLIFREALRPRRENGDARSLAAALRARSPVFVFAPILLPVMFYDPY
jgi:hypothetical protein